MTHDNVTDIERRLRVNSADCSGHEPSLSLLQRTAEEASDTIATLRKQIENARSEALEEAAKMAEEAPIIGPTLSSWINTNESPMGATRRHIANAIRALKGQP